MAKFYSALPIRIKDVSIATRKHLARLPDDYHVCLEFQITKDYDVVIIHPTGIHVIEIKNHIRTVEGGPVDAKWKIKNEDGTVVDTPKNFYNQAVTAADSLKEYLKSRSSELLDNSTCTPFVCSTALCNTHTRFWNSVRPVPYVCFPNWRSKSRVGPHAWCKLSQVSVAPIVGSPSDVVEILQKENWFSTGSTLRLDLSAKEITRIIEKLGCVEIDLATALGEIPSWHPLIDKGIDPLSRAADMDAIRVRLNTDKVVAVVGEPKIGKSTIARLIAEGMQQDGIIVSEYDLRSDDYSGRMAAPQLLTRFLTFAGLPPQATLQDDIANFVGVMRTQRHLLILDNFESALNAESLIADRRLSLLFEQCLNARESFQSFIVITSIPPFRTQSRESVPHYSLHGISHQDALNFLTAAESGWAQEEAECIYSIRQGHPYALRLASLELKRTMMPGISFSVAFEAVKPEIVDLTYRYLFDSFSAEERLVVEILSLEYRGFDLTAIQFIAKRSGLKRNCAPILAQLHERAAIANAGESQFRLLPQDQSYVYDQIHTPEALHEHAVACFQERLEGQAGEQYTVVEDTAARIFFHATRSGNIKAAFGVFMILRERPDMYSFSAALTSMCNQLREHSRFGALSALEQGLVSQYSGRLYRHIGEIDAAVTALTLALKKFQEIGEPVLYAATLSDVALAIRKRGEYGKELELYDQALDVLGFSEEKDAVRTRAYVLGRKAQALQMKGADPQVTFDCYKEAVDLARKTDDKELLVTRLGMLGNAYRELARDFPAAVQCYLEAVQISEQTEGHPDLEAALSGLAKTHEKSRDFEGALTLYLKALAHTEDNDLYGLLDRLGSLAHVYKSMGRLNESIVQYERAISIAAKISNRKAEAENLAGLGSAYRIQANRAREAAQKSDLLDKALGCHRRAVEIQGSMEGDPSGVTNRYQELGRTLLAMKRPAEACPLFVIAARSAHEARKPHVEAWQFRRLGEALDALNRREDAVLCYEQASRLNPDRVDNMKATAEAAFRRIPPGCRQRLMSRLKEIDREINVILERYAHNEL